MGRLIDTDFIPLDVDYDDIKYAPTVDAIPRERIEQMVAEIEKLDTMGVSYQPFINKHDVIDIIHKYTKEQTDD